MEVQQKDEKIIVFWDINIKIEHLYIKFEAGKRYKGWRMCTIDDIRS